MIPPDGPTHPPTYSPKEPRHRSRPSPRRSPNPALEALGDQIEAAAASRIATGEWRSARSRWSRLAIIPVLVVFVLAVLAIAYVSPGGEAMSAEAAVHAAAASTVERSTGEFDVTVHIEGVGELLEGPLELAVTGAYDLDNDRYLASLDTTRLTSALGGLLGERGAEAIGAGTIEVVVDGEDVYLNVGPLAELLGTELRWIKLTVPDLLAQGEGSSPELLAPDASAILDLLGGLDDGATEVGREQVRGVDTTHYGGTISIQKALDSLPGEKRAELEQALSTLFLDSELPEVPVDVWVDDAGLIRRISVRINSETFGLAQMAPDANLSVTVEYFNIGEEVRIPVPSPEEVATLDDLVGEFLGGLEEGFGSLDGRELPEGLEQLGTQDLEGLFDELKGRLPEDLTEDLEGLLGD